MPVFPRCISTARRARPWKKSWRSRPVARHRAVLLRFQGRDAGGVAGVSGRRVRGACAGAGRAAQARRRSQALERLVDLYLDPIASPRKVSVWYSFWGEASSRQEYIRHLRQKDEDFAALVRELIERLIAETGARTWTRTGSRSDSSACSRCCGRVSRFRVSRISIARPPGRCPGLSAFRFSGRVRRRAPLWPPTPEPDEASERWAPPAVFPAASQSTLRPGARLPAWARERKRFSWRGFPKIHGTRARGNSPRFFPGMLEKVYRRRRSMRRAWTLTTLTGTENWICWPVIIGSSMRAAIDSNRSRWGRSGAGSSAGKFKPGKHPQIVIAPGDGTGPLTIYECKGDPADENSWVGRNCWIEI